MSKKDDEYKELLRKAAKHVMTPEEMRAQRIRWVYGTCKLDNPYVTREMVEIVVDQIDRERIKNA